MIFHRVINGFMIQGGCPDGTGMGGPGYQIKGEFSQNGVKNDLLHTEGVLSMARAMHPDSAGSQFFIMHKNSPHLDGQYAAFGKIIEGMDIVDKIATVQTDFRDRPLQEQKMKKVTVDTQGTEYPEHQLFEVDVLSDVCFGPKNQGLSKEECEKRAREALKLVGLKEKYYDASPFELSGGQKRRVAIAGVLAMEPQVLILDEPTAGLDPKGRDEILDQIAYLHKKRNLTVILVSHSMDDIAKYADRIIVMNQGEVMYNDVPKKVFAHYKELEQVGLAAPQVTYIMHELKAHGLNVNTEATTIEEAADSIMEVMAHD